MVNIIVLKMTIQLDIYYRYNLIMPSKKNYTLLRYPNETSVWCAFAYLYPEIYLSRIWPISLKEFTLVLDAKCGKRRTRKTLKGLPLLHITGCPFISLAMLILVVHTYSYIHYIKKTNEVKCINMCTMCVYIVVHTHTFYDSLLTYQCINLDDLRSIRQM